MSRQFLAAIYLLGLATAEFLRWWFRWSRSPRPSMAQTVKLNISGGERIVLVSIFLGIWILPLVYIATDWLESFDYRLSDGVSLIGLVFFFAGLWIRFRSQKDLDQNWSPSLVIWQGHELVTDGIYRWIRHPLYSSLWVWGISQPFLLQNWIAGWIGIVAVGLVHIIRLPREEEMLEDHFGEAYRQYRSRTGGIFPKLGR